MATKLDPYRELELYLAKAQEEIGQVLDQLVERQSKSCELKASAYPDNQKSSEMETFLTKPVADNPSMPKDKLLGGHTGTNTMQPPTIISNNYDIHNKYCLEATKKVGESKVKFNFDRDNIETASRTQLEIHVKDKPKKTLSEASKEIAELSEWAEGIIAEIENLSLNCTRESKIQELNDQKSLLTSKISEIKNDSSLKTNNNCGVDVVFKNIYKCNFMKNPKMDELYPLQIIEDNEVLNKYQSSINRSRFLDEVVNTLTMIEKGKDNKTPQQNNTIEDETTYTVTTEEVAPIDSGVEPDHSGASSGCSTSSRSAQKIDRKMSLESQQHSPTVHEDALEDSPHLASFEESAEPQGLADEKMSQQNGVINEIITDQITEGESVHCAILKKSKEVEDFIRMVESRIQNPVLECQKLSSLVIEEATTCDSSCWTSNEVGTQTSPISLSRTSSLTCVSECDCSEFEAGHSSFLVISSSDTSFPSLTESESTADRESSTLSDSSGDELDSSENQDIPMSDKKSLDDTSSLSLSEYSAKSSDSSPTDIRPKRKVSIQTKPHHCCPSAPKNNKKVVFTPPILKHPKIIISDKCVSKSDQTLYVEKVALQSATMKSRSSELVIGDLIHHRALGPPKPKSPPCSGCLAIDPWCRQKPKEIFVPGYCISNESTLGKGLGINSMMLTLPADLSMKSSSVPFLNVEMRREKSTSDLHSSDESPKSPTGKFYVLQHVRSEKDIAEIEAAEACKWLRAAGFPQYAQLYEDSQFPIDIGAVQKDHDFLDLDSIQSLFRRLNTLNKCARMKLDSPVRKSLDDSDEEDVCALSDKWKFQRSSHRWSRIPVELDAQKLCNPPRDKSFPPASPGLKKPNMSCSSHDSVLTDNSEHAQDDSPTLSKKSHDSSSPLDIPDVGTQSPRHSGSLKGSPINQRLEEMIESSRGQKLQRSGSERLKEGAKALLRRMESLKGKKKKKPKEGIIISGPTLVDNETMENRVQQLNCFDLSPTASVTPSPHSSPLTRDQIPSPFENSSCDASLSDLSTNNTPLQVRKKGKRFFGSPWLLADGAAHSDSEANAYSPVLFNRRVKDSNSNETALIRDTKPGRFPKQICNGYIEMSNGNAINYRTGSFNLGSDSAVYREKYREQKPKDDKKADRLSIYDNVPMVFYNQGYSDKDTADLSETDIFKNIDGLNKSTSEQHKDKESTVAFKEQYIVTSDILPSSHETSDADTLDQDEEQGATGERRDSGVGSTLTRPLGSSRYLRVRWHSFQKSHRPSLTSRSVHISNLSAGQLMVLRKLSLLKLTALMERYSPSNRSGWNWIMPKFIRKMKPTDYKDKTVFGVPFLLILQRTGQPLPRSILSAMRYLRRTAIDAVGIFRKSGVRSRIQKLKNMNETNPDNISYDGIQAYDVADMLKQYFRELPEALLTNKLSETFICTYQYIPEALRLETIQASIMLMPDENREVLQTLLYFLSDIAKHSDENQMTASNLAVCFAPSLFHMNTPRNSSSTSPRNRKGTVGVPDQKELNENKAAYECLAHMIRDCHKLCIVPEDTMMKCRFSYMEQGDPVTLVELGKSRADNKGDYKCYIEACIQGLLKETRDKFKGWVSVSSDENIDLAYKKVGDGHPLRLWKCSVEVEAPPAELLSRVIRERHLWDEDLLKWRIVVKLDKNTEIFQYVSNSMPPHPTRDYCILRSWRTDLPKGACVLVETSVEHPEAVLMGGIRAVVLASRYSIEPCGAGKSRIIHICRTDTRGRTPEWYNKSFGHICVLHMTRIRDTFAHGTEGPETKV